MGSAKTHAHANTVINAYLRTGTVYLGLASAVSDGDAGTVTELAGGNYARQVVTFGAPVAGSTSNTNTVLFPTAATNWPTVTFVLVYSALTGGNLLYYGPLLEPKTITTGERLELPPGAVVLTEE